MVRARSDHGWYKSAFICAQLCMDGEEGSFFWGGKSDIGIPGDSDFSYCMLTDDEGDLQWIKEGGNVHKSDDDENIEGDKKQTTQKDLNQDTETDQDIQMEMHKLSTN